MATAVLRRIIADVDQSRPDLCSSKVHRRSVDDDGRFLVVADRGRRGMSFLPRRVLFVWIGRRWGLKAGVGRRGTMPRFSGDQAWQAVEDDAEARLIGGARGQGDLDRLFQFDDAGGDLDEAQPQGVELHDTPGRGFGHQPAHRPEEPVGTGVKEEAELVGRGLMAGGAVGGEMVLPRLDVVLRLTARAVEPLVERLAAAALEIGDDKASVGSLGAGLDPRDDAFDPAPTAGGIVELRKAPYLAARRVPR